jgi:GTP-binding protein LepA
MQSDGIHKGKEYPELIDTPGGFSYEVSRSSRLRRGTLIVDAAQSIQAQTISNLYLAENDLEIIPVLNKVDLQMRIRSDDIVDLLGCKLEDHLCVRKTGLGVENILAAVIERIPSKEMLMSHYKL